MLRQRILPQSEVIRAICSARPPLAHSAALRRLPRSQPSPPSGPPTTTGRARPGTTAPPLKNTPLDPPCRPSCLREVCTSQVLPDAAQRFRAGDRRLEGLRVPVRALAMHCPWGPGGVTICDSSALSHPGGGGHLTGCLDRVGAAGAPPDDLRGGYTSRETSPGCPRESVRCIMETITPPEGSRMHLDASEKRASESLFRETRTPRVAPPEESASWGGAWPCSQRACRHSHRTQNTRTHAHTQQQLHVQRAAAREFATGGWDALPSTAGR